MASLPRWAAGCPNFPEIAKAIRDAKARVSGENDIKNEPHAAAAVAIIRTFGDSPAARIYIEPGTARSTRRPADVVLCHPDYGLVVFEVKGYRSEQIDSIEANNLIIRQRGLLEQIKPYQQAEKAMFNIKKEVKPPLADGYFHFMVVLPNISVAEWERRGFTKAFPQDVLCLWDHLESDQFREQVKKLVGTHRLLTPEQMKRIIEAFGDSGSFGPYVAPPTPPVPHSLGAVIDKLAVLDKRLSSEQAELSRLKVEGFPRLIRGVAGSGKTIVLANLVARVLNRQKDANLDLFDDFEPEHLRIAVICFNRALVPLLHQKIKDAYKQQTFENVPAPDILWVGHLNSFMRKVTCKRNPELQFLPIDFGHPSKNATLYRGQVSAFLCKHPERASEIQYDAIFVDEGQDFETEEFELLLDLLRPDERTREKNLIICYDDAQNLYGKPRPVWNRLKIDVQRGGRARVMKECFRNTREIVETAFNVLLGTQAAEKDKVNLRTYADADYLRKADLITDVGSYYRVSFAERRGPIPLVKGFQSRCDEKEWIAYEISRLVTVENVRPEDILVLFSQEKDGFEDLDDVIRRAISSEFVEEFIKPYNTKDEGHNDDKNHYIFREQHLTLSTVHGAKGHDAYIVFLAGVDLFRTDAKGRSLFYVGATRAKLLLNITGMSSPLLLETQRVLARRSQLELTTAARVPKLLSSPTTNG